MLRGLTRLARRSSTTHKGLRSPLCFSSPSPSPSSSLSSSGTPSSSWRYFSSGNVVMDGDLPDWKALRMPSLSPTMEIGNITEWKMKEGDEFEAGDVLATIETDKTVVDFEVLQDGVLARILLPDGSQDVSVGTPIGITVEDVDDVGAFKDADVDALFGEEASSAGAETGDGGMKSEAGATEETAVSRDAGESGRSPSITFRYGKREEEEKKVEASSTSSSASTLTTPTPPAATTSQAATAAGVDGARAAAEDLVAGAAVDVAGRSFTDVPVSQMRRVIASRLAESKATVPHLYSSIQVRADAVLALRAKWKAEMGVSVSVNDFIMKAVGKALAKESNQCFLQQWDDVKGEPLQYTRNGEPAVDVCVAVATDGGLITPIVKDADRLALSSIGSEVRDLAGRARESRLKPEEFQGGCFTVSNLGMYGITEFSAVINPPQSAILAIGSSVPLVQPTSADAGGMESVTTISVRLSSDRRVISEAQAASFLNDFVSIMEDPNKMAV